MMRTSKLSMRLRAINWLNRALLRVGVPMGPVYLLSVPGRTSGALRTTPITPLEFNGQRWLVAGFDTADWVKNVRAARWAILSRGRHSERVTAVELPPSERAPVLQAFVRQVLAGPSVTGVARDAPLEAFEAIVSRHPVFRVTEPVESLSSMARDATSSTQ
jgi:deazaflavin-dependent oxidoreductase (nitroreductase family)